MLLAAMLTLNPLGFSFIEAAFFAGEQLTRNIAQPILLTAMAIAAVIILLEWLTRVLILKRRKGGATTA
jgi:hypothetical protein